MQLLLKHPPGDKIERRGITLPSRESLQTTSIRFFAFPEGEMLPGMTNYCFPFPK